MLSRFIIVRVRYFRYFLVFPVFLRYLRYENGFFQVIIQQDTSVDKFYFLNSGDVQVFKNGESCGFLKAGEVFNLNEMFSERENAYEFKVYTEVELYCWEKADLMRVLGTVWEPFTAGCYQIKSSIFLKNRQKK